METRKNPEKDLKKSSGLFFQIGLLAALLLIVSAFEWETPENGPEVVLPRSSEDAGFIDPKITVQKPPERPKPRQIVTVVSPAKDEDIDVDLSKYQLDNVSIEIEDPVDLPAPPDKKADVVKDYVDEMPTPKGGLKSFYSFIGQHVEYTRQARNINLEGTVFVSFIVDENGHLYDIKVVKGVGAGLDEQALEAVKKSPDWNPGRQAGRRVKVRMMIPVKFRLDR